jgi:hypothetical protein
LHLCDREGLDHVTSFLTRASGGVTPYCIRARKSGKAERGAGERCEVVANEERGSWDGAQTLVNGKLLCGHLQEKGMLIGGRIEGKGQRTWSQSYVGRNWRSLVGSLEFEWRWWRQG